MRTITLSIQVYDHPQDGLPLTSTGVTALDVSALLPTEQAALIGMRAEWLLGNALEHLDKNREAYTAEVERAMRGETGGEGGAATDGDDQGGAGAEAPEEADPKPDTEYQA